MTELKSIVVTSEESLVIDKCVARCMEWDKADASKSREMEVYKSIRETFGVVKEYILEEYILKNPKVVQSGGFRLSYDPSFMEQPGPKAIPNSPKAEVKIEEAEEEEKNEDGERE